MHMTLCEGDERSALYGFTSRAHLLDGCTTTDLRSTDIFSGHILRTQPYPPIRDDREITGT
jgi:hypothetical protein